MGEFFKQPFLDKIYDSITENFQECILEEINEAESYRHLIESQMQIVYMLIEIPKDKKDKDKLIKGISKLKEYFHKEIEFWDRRYFKLGFTYMEILRNPKEFICENNFYLQIYNFLEYIKVKKIDEKQKSLLRNFINILDNCTETQKRRFFMYYNLMPNSNKIFDYSDIGKIEHCSCNIIKNSVNSIILQLTRLEDSQKSLFLTIINEIDI